MALELSGLEGKVVLITGAGRMRSIGRGIAQTLAQAGCDIVITGSGRDPEHYPDEEKQVGWHDIESVAEEVRGMGRRALPLVSDVSDLDAVTQLADDVLEQMGRIDFVINNAGAARAGVVNLTKSLAYEWGRHGITLNSIGPGTIETEALEQYDWDAMVEGVAALPVARMGTPLEVAELVAFLCSSAGGYITGALVPLDGGEHLTGSSMQTPP